MVQAAPLIHRFGIEGLAIAQAWGQFKLDYGCDLG